MCGDYNQNNLYQEGSPNGRGQLPNDATKLYDRKASFFGWFVQVEQHVTHIDMAFGCIHKSACGTRLRVLLRHVPNGMLYQMGDRFGDVSSRVCHTDPT